MLRYCSAFTVASTPYNSQGDLGDWLYSWAELYDSAQEHEVESTGVEKIFLLFMLIKSFLAHLKKGQWISRLKTQYFYFRN